MRKRASSCQDPRSTQFASGQSQLATQEAKNRIVDHDETEQKSRTDYHRQMQSTKTNTTHRANEIKRVLDKPKRTCQSFFLTSAASLSVVSLDTATRFALDRMCGNTPFRQSVLRKQTAPSSNIENSELQVPCKSHRETILWLHNRKQFEFDLHSHAAAAGAWIDSIRTRVPSTQGIGFETQQQASFRAHEMVNDLRNAGENERGLERNKQTSSLLLFVNSSDSLTLLGLPFAFSASNTCK